MNEELTDQLDRTVSDGRCAVPGCRGIEDMSFYSYPVCQDCWEDDCDGDIDLKKIFDIKERAMKVTKEDAVVLLKAVGFAEAESFSPSRLGKKLNAIKNLVEKDQKIDHPQFDAVMEALNKGEVVELDGDGGSVKKETAKAPKETGPRESRETKGRPYHAGVVIQKHGVGKATTEEMIAEVDAATGKTNAKESAFCLGRGRQSIRGYLDSLPKAG